MQYITRDMSTLAKSDPLRGLRVPQAKKPVTPVFLTSVRPKAKPVHVVYLYDQKKKADDLYWIRKLERAGLTEGNSKAVALMKANFLRRYGQRV